MEVDVAGLSAAWPGIFLMQVANYSGDTAVAGRGPANAPAGVQPQPAAGELYPWATGEFITLDITNSQPGGVCAPNEQNRAVTALLLVVCSGTQAASIVTSFLVLAVAIITEWKECHECQGS